MALQVAQPSSFDLERRNLHKRGHGSELSISDDSHHITEAIGDMYGDRDRGGKRENRPLSWVKSPSAETFDQSGNSRHENSRPSPTASTRPPLAPTESNDRLPHYANGSPKGSRSPSYGRENEADFSQEQGRPSSQLASQKYSISNIDYESSPAAVAQELSNLQALRRMSMDVSAAVDPDLPSFSSSPAVPTTAPGHNADPDDASRLFWVPARVHPELEPTAFKSFIEDKVSRIKRRSGGEESFSSENSQGLKSPTGSGLRRKKSMLSRQVDEPSGYKDGAERLERKRSSGQQVFSPTIANIQELETIVKDPTSLMRQLSVDSTRRGSDAGSDLQEAEDMPILPPAPGGQTLKRSTRTKYRRGSLRKGERQPSSRRQLERDAQSEAGSPVFQSQSEPLDDPIRPLVRVQTEPIPTSQQDQFSPSPKAWEAPSRIDSRDASNHTGQVLQAEGEAESQKTPAIHVTSESASQTPSQKTFVSKIASNGRTTASFPSQMPNSYSNHEPKTAPLPDIPQQARPRIDRPAPASRNNQQIPERKSSHEPPIKLASSNNARIHIPGRSTSRPGMLRQQPPQPTPSTTFDEIVSHPSPLPGSGSTRTDTLSFIPMLPEEQKIEKKVKDRKDGSDGSRKSSWGWLRGNEEKERERDGKQGLKKSRSKNTKQADPTRFDVLQTSIEGGGKGRESLILDRDSTRLDEERKKDSNRKTSGDRKDKDSGILSTIFGGKRKGEKEGGKKANSIRGPSPEPLPKMLKPDIDYNWTRFSILEERAIYRIAHFKLAETRRPLHSQVLLSNFMYSYLAKVQQMHPQMQMAQPVAQKRAQEQRVEEPVEDQSGDMNIYDRYHEG